MISCKNSIFLTLILMVFCLPELSSQTSDLPMIYEDVEIVPATDYHRQLHHNLKLKVDSYLKTKLTSLGIKFIEKESLLASKAGSIGEDRTIFKTTLSLSEERLEDFLHVKLISGNGENRYSKSGMIVVSRGGIIDSLDKNIAVLENIFSTDNSCDRKVQELVRDLEDEKSMFFDFEEKTYLIIAKPFFYEILEKFNNPYKIYTWTSLKMFENLYHDENGKNAVKICEVVTPVINKHRIETNSLFIDIDQHKPCDIASYITQEKNIFNVLVFPFDTYDTCDEALGQYCTKAVRDLMISQGQNENINIQVKINKQFNTLESPLDYDTAEKISQVTGADLLLWGDYERKCEWDSTLINVKYHVRGAVNLLKSLDRSSETGITKVNAISEILTEQKLVGNIKDIVKIGLAKLQTKAELKESLYNDLDSTIYTANAKEIYADILRVARSNQNKEKSEEYLNLLYEIDSTDIEILGYFATYYSAYNKEKSLKYFERLIQSNYHNLTYLHAEVLDNLRRRKEAIDLILSYEKHCIDCSREFYFAFLGNLYANSSNDSLAIQFYQKALQLSPGYTPVRVRMANILAKVGRDSLAEKEYQLAIKLEGYTSNYLDHYFGFLRSDEQRLLDYSRIHLSKAKDGYHRFEFFKKLTQRLRTDSIIRETLELIPTSNSSDFYVEYMILRYDLLLQLNRYEEALNVLDKKKFRPHHFYEKRYVLAHMLLGNHDNALLLVEESREFKETTEGLYYTGLLHLLKGSSIENVTRYFHESFKKHNSESSKIKYKEINAFIRNYRFNDIVLQNRAEFLTRPIYEYLLKKTENDFLYSEDEAEVKEKNSLIFTLFREYLKASDFESCKALIEKYKILEPSSDYYYRNSIDIINYYCGTKQYDEAEFLFSTFVASRNINSVESLDRQIERYHRMIKDEEFFERNKVKSLFNHLRKRLTENEGVTLRDVASRDMFMMFYRRSILF